MNDQIKTFPHLWTRAGHRKGQMEDHSCWKHPFCYKRALQLLLEGSTHLVFTTADACLESWERMQGGFQGGFCFVLVFLKFFFYLLGHVSETLKLYFVVEFKLTHCLSDVFRWRPLRYARNCSWILPTAMILRLERIQFCTFPLQFCHFISFCISTAVVCWMLQSKLTNESSLLNSWE